ncbi:membrane magnesium transporter, putative [Plasmodium gallinaceum]|uniref:Membrane magnesium transporter, putative n=1 Tax=Plasmodium gallinaceum TaxID=5849 RepID=A0A1J1GS43_PLAGA|nr:membrane magnesium transporter, putative [Plasmodium gallinaceum]CRG95295.1 membrane magnesium transporter, putative [Plasmodium gallinaceum]
MNDKYSVSITLLGLASLLKSGHSVYLHLNRFKLENENMENFAIPHMLVIQIILCALITMYGGSKLFLKFQNIKNDSSQNFNNHDWDKNHTRQNFRHSFNRKYFIKDYVRNYINKAI